MRLNRKAAWVRKKNRVCREHPDMQALRRRTHMHRRMEHIISRQTVTHRMVMASKVTAQATVLTDRAAHPTVPVMAGRAVITYLR